MAPKRNLVVIGNGMSGARSVEEILARGGAELFNIAMFGAEPTGNYNRIMLAVGTGRIAAGLRNHPQSARVVRAQ